MRVVADGPDQTRRSGDSGGGAAGASGNAVALPAPARAVGGPASAAASTKQGLPILGAMLFLVAATIGGALIGLSGIAG